MPITGSALDAEVHISPKTAAENCTFSGPFKPTTHTGKGCATYMRDLLNTRATTQKEKRVYTK